MQRRFHHDNAASAQGFAWPGNIGLSLQPHLRGIRDRAALATDRHDRCPPVASLVSTLVAAAAIARFLPRIHRRCLLARLSDVGDAAMAFGVGISHRRYLHRGGRRANHRTVGTARGGTFDLADGPVPARGVDTEDGRRFNDGISVG